MRSEPDVDAGADFCYDFLNYAIRVPAPKDSCLQGDLCDSLIALGDLQALAIEDVIGDGEFESVEYCRKYLQWPAGENAKKALKESGGPMADLLL